MTDNVTDPNLNRNEHDDTGGVLGKRVKNFVWNTNTLAWDKETQAGSGGGGAVTIADGADVTLGAKADAKSTATDTTSITAMSVLKQISASVQAPPSQAVTNAGTFAVQAAGDVASGASDSGNPVKAGGIYKTTPDTLTDGQRGNLTVTTRGALRTTLVTNDSVTVYAARNDNVDGVAVAATTNNLAVLNRNTVYNGTSWDRMSGDTTGINVKAVVGALPTGSNTIGALTANQSVNQAQVAGNTTSVGVGASGTGTQRIVQANDAGKTLVSKGGSVASSGDNTLVSAGTNKLKVYAFSLSTSSTTAVTCIFQSGASGTELWRVVLQAPTSVTTGANLAITPPAWLFATAAATLLNLNLSAAQTVHYSISYYDEA